MDPDQFIHLMKVFEKLADRQFSISQATDWPLLVVGGGLLISLTGFMWRDLRSTMISKLETMSIALKEYRDEARESLQRLRNENDRDHDVLRAEIKEVREIALKNRDKD